jgi:hypothetical protein
MANLFANKIASSSNNPQFNCSLIGVKKNEQQQENIFVYPNPAHHQLYIKVVQDLIGKRYKIYNVFGNIVLFGNITSTITVTEIDKLKQGIYFLNIEGKSKGVNFTVNTGQ